MRAFIERPEATIAVPVERAQAPRPRIVPARVKRTTADGDLGFELYRQNTLLVILATCLRRTSEDIIDPLGLDLHRVDRALEVHRDYVVHVHYPDVDLVNEALESQEDPRAFEGLVECKAEHARAQLFQSKVADLLRPSTLSTVATAAALSRALREEADRLEMHLGREEELLQSRLSEWLPRSRQARLLQQIRKFDAPRIAAEIAILVWASELGPSAD